MNIDKYYKMCTSLKESCMIFPNFPDNMCSGFKTTVTYIIKLGIN